MAKLSKWRNYQIAVGENEKANLFLFLNVNPPKVIILRLCFLCLSSQLLPDDNLGWVSFLRGKKETFITNTHVLTKQGLDVEINFICECVTMTKTVTAVKTQSATKTISLSAWTQALMSFILWLERDIKLSSRNIKMIKYCIWIENSLLVDLVIEINILHYATSNLLEK